MMVPVAPIWLGMDNLLSIVGLSLLILAISNLCSF